MTRDYDSDGFRQTATATERRFPCGRTRQVVTADWEEARRLLASMGGTKAAPE